MFKAMSAVTITPAIGILVLADSAQGKPTTSSSIQTVNEESGILRLNYLGFFSKTRVHSCLLTLQLMNSQVLLMGLICHQTSKCISL